MTVRNDHHTCSGCQELRVVFLISKETDVIPGGSIQRGHAGKLIGFVTTYDVAIDEVGEFGKA